MTENQFWMKLDQIAQKRNKEGVFIEARKVLKQAYEDDLRVVCAVVRNREDPTLCRQLYIGMTEEKPEPNGNRYMLCYTNRRMAEQDYAASRAL